jgi:hypothetical protein
MKFIFNPDITGMDLVSIVLFSCRNFERFLPPYNQAFRSIFSYLTVKNCPLCTDIKMHLLFLLFCWGAHLASTMKNQLSIRASIFDQAPLQYFQKACLVCCLLFTMSVETANLRRRVQARFPSQGNSRLNPIWASYIYNLPIR